MPVSLVKNNVTESNSADVSQCRVKSATIGSSTP